MRLSIRGKYMYLMIISIIALLGIVIVPTYAKFMDNYVTENDVVGFKFDFDIKISNIDEYEEIEVAPGEMARFNVEVSNNTGGLVYYGIWYKLADGKSMPNNNSIQIGKLKGTDVSSSGSVEDNDSIAGSFGIINGTNSAIKMYVGVGSSSTGISDIEYLNGKELITGEVNIVRDIAISSITIDGKISDSLPKKGYYTMKYNCSRGSVLSWDSYNKSITYEVGSKVRDICSLTFTSSDDYSLLNKMKIGSYVDYTGVLGKIGNKDVSCQSLSGVSEGEEVNDNESLNSCAGHNVNEEKDESNYTYGYSGSDNYRYYTTGWRIGYIKDNKVMLVSAGSPYVINRKVGMDNVTYTKIANAMALRYCNSNFVDGDCRCNSSNDEYCDNASSDVWAISDSDFYYMTKAISGVGKRLTEGSSNLGDIGGSLGNDLFCLNRRSLVECGYNNDLIDNGSAYWFATSNYGESVFWNPKGRYVSSLTKEASYGLRIVVSLSDSVYVTGGSGTMEDPYTIDN